MTDRSHQDCPHCHCHCHADDRLKLTEPTERVAKAAARALLAANERLGVPSDAKTEWLARS